MIIKLASVIGILVLMYVVFFMQDSIVFHNIGSIGGVCFLIYVLIESGFGFKTNNKEAVWEKKKK